PGRPPLAPLDPDLFFTAPSTPVRVRGARPQPPAEEQTDGESEGLCSPPTSPSGSYMTAEGGSWGSSGTASTSPSCSPNLAAEAEAMAATEDEGNMAEDNMVEDNMAEDNIAGPDEDDGPFAPPGDDEDEEDDGHTLEEEEEEDEEEEEEWEVSGGLIPAALLPFRGSLLFQAEAVEIAPLRPATAAIALPGDEEEEEDEDEEEEEEDGSSTSASYLHSLSDTSIAEGVDESFAFRDDTSASSDSAAYDGEEDERLYGTERHAAAATGPPPATSVDGGIELHLHTGTSPEGSPRHRHGVEDTKEELGDEDVEQDGSQIPLAPPGEDGVEADGETFLTSTSSSSSELEEAPTLDPEVLLEPIVGECPLTEPLEEVAAVPVTEEELVAPSSVLQPPSPCSRDPQTHELGGHEVAPANGEPQGGRGSDGDSDHEVGDVRVGSTELAATNGHDELVTMATELAPSMTPSLPDDPETVAMELAP
ncbi:NACAD protein, partial [Nyctibius bracteatus]|nr:NACAD protein [Nyctibius bracteatus]